MSDNNKSLWELLWDFDPNGLVAVDREMNIRVVNPAFCRMFRVNAYDVIGKPAVTVLGSTEDFEAVLATADGYLAREREYFRFGLYVRQVMFTIAREGITGCIFVDLTREWRQKAEINKLKRATIDHVKGVVDNQMRAAQEIASLLGETAAASKVSLLKLVETVEQDAESILS